MNFKTANVILIIVMIFSLSLIYVQTIHAEEDGLASLLPSEMKEKGFTNPYKYEFYDDRNLFDYIDGGAPYYIDRGFERLVTEAYSKDGESFTVDIYRMKDAKSAVTLLEGMKKKGLPKPAFGADGQEGKNQTEFIRGKYFVRITAFKSDPKTLAVIKDFGKAVDSRIQKKEKGAK
ncbi:MAG: hypothetical protein HZA77_08285 [Candidatus Schekmanbacteria bacterium]|nr:hypothetical protein [Candidatus Schekmanbacteria bacterium]